MARKLVPRFLAALHINSLDDEKLHALRGAVELTAKTSPLVLASPALRATIAAIGVADDDLTAADEAIADDRTKLRADIATAAVARSAILGLVRTLGSQIACVATSPADVELIGLSAQPPRAPRGQMPPVPEAIDCKPPRTGRGKTTVSVHETGPIHYEYAAEESVDGITWSQLGVGRGKTRVVTGASGAQVWVRFAAVRGQRQSAWGTPVLVTIP